MAFKANPVSKYQTQKMSLKVSTVGIIGGGQLGMFLAHSCSKLGLRVFVYSDSKKVPAEKYADKMFYGSFEDIESLKIFSSEVDLITYEAQLKNVGSFLYTFHFKATIGFGNRESLHDGISRTKQHYRCRRHWLSVFIGRKAS